MAYLTVAQANSHMGLTDQDDDALISALIDRAQEVIDAHFGRSFEAAADSTRYFDSERDIDPDDPDVLFLDEDLCAITSITMGDGDVLTAGEYTTLPVNRTPWYGLRLLPSANIVWEENTNGDTEKAITIVGKWAYSATADNGIVHLTAELVTQLYRGREATGDLNRTIVSGGVVIKPAELSTAAQLVWHSPRYKRIV